MGSNAVYPLWPAFAAARRLAAGRASRARSSAAACARTPPRSSPPRRVALLVANEWPAFPPSPSCSPRSSCWSPSSAPAGARRQPARVAGRRPRTRLVDDVRDAIERGELDLHFQPLVDAGTGAVTRRRGAAALAPRRRLRPARHVPARGRAQRPDRPADRLRARPRARRRRRLAPVGHEIGINVNLATANLSEADLPGRVLPRCAATTSRPRALTLEITETAAVDDTRWPGTSLPRSRAGRRRSSIDDFGTGHSRSSGSPLPDLRAQDRPLVRAGDARRGPPDRRHRDPARERARPARRRRGYRGQLTLDACASSAATSRRAISSRARCPRAEFAAWLRTPYSSNRTSHSG